MTIKTHRYIFTLTFLLILMQGCAKPYAYTSKTITGINPVLYPDHAVMNDGYRLPLHWWGDPESAKAIVLALHGMNDYRNAYQSTGNYLSMQKIAVVAYDQRGFGETTGTGYWHGSQKMIDDSMTMLQLLQSEYPKKKLFIMGESMGGAVILASMGDAELHGDGVILLAPAVWSREAMPWYQRLLLWLAAHTVPDKKLTGKNLDITPSDNIDMLRAMGRDPLVIKETRVDVLYGITNLMDLAAGSASNFSETALILYGKHDDIIPRIPTCKWLASLPAETKTQRTVVLYENGYHMLNRDLQAVNVFADISKWINQVISDQSRTEKNQRHPMQVAGSTYELSEFCSQ